MENRGGDINKFLVEVENYIDNDIHEGDLDKETVKLAKDVRNLILQLAKFLKEHELQGSGQFFFKNGRLFLDYVLWKVKLRLLYDVVYPGMTHSPKVIVKYARSGLSVGLVGTWFIAGTVVGTIVLIPTTIFSTWVIRSGFQQILNIR